MRGGGEEERCDLKIRQENNQYGIRIWLMGPSYFTLIKMRANNWLPFQEIRENCLRASGECDSQLFQAGNTVCHCLTSFKVKIQLDHFCIGDGSYIDVHKFICA
jgi:hypothetical protein